MSEEDFLGYEGLPSFASRANRSLDAFIKQTERDIERLDAQIGGETEALKIMDAHMANVRQELVNTQQLVDAKTREIETEDHLKQLADREKSRYLREVGKLDKEIEEVQEKLNVTHNSVFRAQEQIEQIKQQTNWNNEELEQWAVAARQKEEDNLALEKYKRQDEAKIRELDLQIQRLTKAIAQKKQDLADEITETQACQIELDKNAEDFRNLHKERQGLIVQFQKALEAMKQRDDAIQKAAEKYAAGKREIAAREIAIAERNKFLEQEMEQNKQDEAKIAAAERFVARNHTERQSREQEIVELKDEVEVMRGTMMGSAAELLKRRTELTEMKNSIEEYNKRIEQLQQEFEVTKHRLESEFQHTDDLEAQARQLEELRKMQESKLKQRDKEIIELRETQFKLSQELFKLRQKESTLVAEIAGAQSALKNVNTTINKLDQESQKQQELVYAADFQIQQMERKVARAQGERTEDEKKEIMLRIEMLQAQLDEHNATNKMLVQQRKRVSDDLREKKRQLAQVLHTKAQLTQVIADLTLTSDTTALAAKNLQSLRDKMVVQHDILKLDITKLRDTLNQKADEVFGLENRKFQLKMSMQEREHEISVHREVLQSAFKIADDERHRAHLQVADRTMKCDKIKKKYELLMAKFAPSSDPDAPEGASEAFFLIRAAQEKQELERQGDELDAQIRKAEKEVRALENTLAMLNARNSKYRQSFHKVERGDPELKVKEQLQDQLRAVNDRVKFKKAEIKELMAEVATMQRSTNVLREDKAKLVKRIQDLEMQCAHVRKEAEEYGQKLREAHLEMEQLSMRHRQTHGDPARPDHDTLEERDFRLLEVKYSTDHLMDSLAHVANQPRNTDVAIFLERVLPENGLDMPNRPSTARTDHSESGRGGGGGGDRFGSRSGGGRRSFIPNNKD